MTDLIKRDAVLDLIASMPGARTAELYNAAARIPLAAASGTKPSIDWSHVAPQFNWLSRDRTDHVYLHARRPKVNGEGWDTVVSFWANTAGFASVTPGTCDWRDSLVMRPGHVEADE